MADVVILSDNTSAGYFGISRYMGPYSLATLLEEAGYNVAVFDYISRNPNIIRQLENSLNENTLVVGISTTFMTPLSTLMTNEKKYSVRIDNAYEYVGGLILFPEIEVLEKWLNLIRDLINRKAPRAKIVVGGAKLQFLFDYPDNFKNIDYVAIGSGERNFLNLVESINASKDPDYFLHKNRKILNYDNKSNKTIGCPKATWHKKWGIQFGEALPIEISRGCIFNCKFCHYDKKESFRKKINDLRFEFLTNYEQFGTTFYHFCDDCFNDHPEKVRAVCEMITRLPFKIEWISYARVEVAIKYPDLTELMIKSGAKGFFWGIESFNYEVARRAGKGAPTEKVKSFLKEFYLNYGEQCTSSGSFIVGLPGETPESQEETIKWVTNERALHFIDVMPLKLRPYYSNLDFLMTDFAEYSRNPQKYGLNLVQFNPPYWEHETMNSKQAYRISEEFNLRWKSASSTHRGLIYSIWTYPNLRSLGFTQEEVREIQTSESKKESYRGKVIDRFNKRLSQIFDSNNLIESNIEVVKNEITKPKTTSTHLQN